MCEIFAETWTRREHISDTSHRYTFIHTESNTMLQTSKLTTKYQATVPTSVRKVLQLKAGDMVGFEINGDEVKSAGKFIPP